LNNINTLADSPNNVIGTFNTTTGSHSIALTSAGTYVATSTQTPGSPTPAADGGQMACSSGGPTALATTPTNSSCGLNNGSVTLGATTGGTAPFTYNFNNLGFSSTTTYSGLAPGTYPVVVKDKNGCSFSKNVVIGSSPGPTALAVTPTKSNCGLNNGSVSIGATTGGTSPFTYNFNNLGFSATTSYTGLAAGTYPVVVKDKNGCTFSTTVTVGNNAGPTALTVTPTKSNCSTNSGSAVIGATTGGTGPYSYNFNNLGYSTTTTYSNLAAGTYTVIVKDANGCTFTTTTVIGDNPGPTGLATTPANSNCGTNTGSVSIGAVTGGTAPYSYNFNNLGYSGTTSYSGLGAGTYTVIVKDTHGCTFSVTVSVGNNTGPTALATTPTNSNCGTNTGSVTIGATTGGTGPYSYNFNNLGYSATTTYSNLASGTYTVIVKDVNGCTYSTTATVGDNAGPTALAVTPSGANCGVNNGSVAIGATTGGTGPYSYNFNNLGYSTTTSYTNLAAGTYTVLVKDVHGCIFSTTTTVANNTGPAVASSSVNNSSCNAGCTGSATVNASGGNGTLTYSWSPSGGTLATTPPTLCAGTYTCTVKDALGCTTTKSVTLTDPSAIAITTVSSVPAACNQLNGSATISATGGKGGTYTYSWSPSGGSAPTASGLGAGSYSITVSDSAGCTKTSGVNITNAGGPVATANPATNVTCFGSCNGAASVSAAGGSGPLTYSWSPSGGSTAAASGLCAGTYTCSVRDTNNCLATQSFTITQPAVLAIAPSQINVACASGSSGSATANVNGGTGAGTYTYSWAPSGGTGPVASGLTAGTYTCAVTDANGCPASQTYTITEPPVLTATGGSTNSTCGLNNGVVYTTASGGTGTYTYSWSPSAGTADTLKGLGAGTYSCMVTDSNGCSQKAVVILSNSGNPPVAVITPSSSTTFCQGDSVHLMATGGGTYSWSTGATTAQITATSAGNYTVTVTNACGISTASSTVVIKPLPVAGASGAVSICAGDSTMLNASGGTSYSWSPGGQTTSSFYTSTAGIYTVTVSNSCGSSTKTDTVHVNSVTAQFIADSVSGYAAFTVNFTNTSSASASTWFWDFGDGSTGTSQNPSHTYTATGTYNATLTATDSHGCTSTYSIVITVNDLPSWILVPNVFTPNGDGTNDLFLIKGQGITEFNVKIYDRWGVELAEITNPKEGWDARTKAGVQASDGTYYYLLKAKGDDSRTYDLKGFFTLVR
jgi:gliding motility-associated-like protein